MRYPVHMLATVLAILAPASAGAQTGAVAVTAEREAYAEWLLSGVTSPYAVVIQRPIGPGVTVGPGGADVPLEHWSGPGLRITERDGMAYLEERQGGVAQERPLPRFRPVPVRGYRFMIGGPAGRGVLVLYAPSPRNPKPPRWFPYDPSMSVDVDLVAPAQPRERRMLAADGLEVMAAHAGSVRVRLRGATTELQVYRIPDITGEESDLEIFFRDGTNADATYPAGRFVTLVPLSGRRYRLDLNRARNPFCAYNTVFACPLPWRGNNLPFRVEAGERYGGGGLTPSGSTPAPAP